MWSFNISPNTATPYIYEIMVLRALLYTVQRPRSKNIQQSQRLGYFGQMILLEVLVKIITRFNMVLVQPTHGTMELTQILGLGEHLANIMRHVGCTMYR